MAQEKRHGSRLFGCTVNGVAKRNIVHRVAVLCLCTAGPIFFRLLARFSQKMCTRCIDIVVAVFAINDV